MGAVASVAGILLLLGCLCLGYLAVRRVRLMRGGGVDVCLRRQGPGRRPARVAGTPRRAGTSASAATRATSSPGSG